MKKMFRTAGLAIIAAALSFTTYAQQFEIGNVPKGWHLKDLKTDGYYGISLDKAYDFVKQKGLKSTPVIVGIIDSGIDTTHEDLKPVLWVNKKEIPGNGIDDDKNGYIDDIYGWNFLGSNDGTKNVEKDSYEAARFYWKYKNKYEGKTEAQVAAADKAEFKTWQRSRGDVFKTEGNSAEEEFMLQMVEAMKRGDEVIKRELKKDVYNCTDLKNYNPTALVARQMREMMLNICRGNDNDEISNSMLLSELDKEIDKIAIKKNPPKEYRNDVVDDKYDDINDKYYGNNNLYVTNDGAMHGTHVAGIIGAKRGNGLGMDGVADNVELMSLRAVPDGDEHDKDIALSIRYAVDNGARIINMSFGKGFSPQKHWVDDAVRYADSKGVLLVHAAGNDAKNNDTTHNYPSAYYSDKTRPKNWITVGASGDPKAGGLVANFSNYGKTDVDVFAPGVKIYSTVPGGNTYQDLQGTSMASPVVAGLAAFIMNYYPRLTATQVKDIIMRSAIKPEKKVTNPQTLKDVSLSDLSVTGGIVNAYEAIKLADAVSRGETAPVKVTPAAKKPAVKKKK